MPKEINFTRERPLSKKKVFYLLENAIKNDNLKGDLFAIKGPVNSMVFGKMAGLLPEARFVYIIRDPRDVFNSHLQGNQEWMKGINSTIQGCLGKTRKYFEGYLSAVGLPNVHVLKYEDLHQHFAHTYERLCEFLKVERSPEVIKRAHQRSSFKSMTRRPHSQPDPDMGARKGVIGEWTTSLNQDDKDWLRNERFWTQFFKEFNYTWEWPTIQRVLKAFSSKGARNWDLMQTNDTHETTGLNLAVLHVISGACGRSGLDNLCSVCFEARNQGFQNLLAIPIGLIPFDKNLLNDIVFKLSPQRDNVIFCCIVSHRQIEDEQQCFALAAAVRLAQEEFKVLGMAGKNYVFYEADDQMSDTVFCEILADQFKLFSIDPGAESDFAVIKEKEGLVELHSIPENVDFLQPDSLGLLVGANVLLTTDPFGHGFDQPLQLAFRANFGPAERR